MSIQNIQNFRRSQYEVDSEEVNSEGVDLREAGLIARKFGAARLGGSESSMGKSAVTNDTRATPNTFGSRGTVATCGTLGSRGAPLMKKAEAKALKIAAMPSGADIGAYATRMMAENAKTPKGGVADKDASFFGNEVNLHMKAMKTRGSNAIEKKANKAACIPATFPIVFGASRFNNRSYNSDIQDMPFLRLTLATGTAGLLRALQMKNKDTTAQVPFVDVVYALQAAGAADMVNLPCHVLFTPDLLPADPDDLDVDVAAKMVALILKQDAEHWFTTN